MAKQKPPKIVRANRPDKEFYPLNHDFLSSRNKNSTKGKTRVAAKHKGLAKALNGVGKYSVNVVKSIKNLAFDVVDEFVPELKGVRQEWVEATKDTIAETKAQIQDTVGNSLKAILGEEIHSPKDAAKAISKQVKAQVKDVKDAIKTGNLYESESARMESLAAQSFGGDDDFDFGDDDWGDDWDDEGSSGGSSKVLVPSGEDQLSEEPFGGVTSAPMSYQPIQAKRAGGGKAGVTVNYNIRSGGGNGGVGQGDKLVSNMTGAVGTSIMSQMESVYARQMAASDIHFNNLLNFQNEILKGVNHINEHLTTIGAQTSSATMEFQGKMIGLQEETLAAMKELQETIVATTTYQMDKEEEDEEQLGRFGGAGKTNAKDTLKRAKGAALNMLYELPIAQLSMVKDMLDMTDGMMEGGIGQMFNIKQMAVKGIGKSLLSKNSKAALMRLGETFDHLGPMLSANASAFARKNAGKDGIAGFAAKFLQNMGLGKLQSQAKVGLTVQGLGDKVNETVPWTRRSDETLNVVIPAYLSKIEAAVAGTEQRIWDWKTGHWTTKKMIEHEIEMRTKYAYENADLNRIQESVNTEAIKVALGYDKNWSGPKTLAEKQKMEQDMKSKGFDNLTKDFEVIKKNIIASGEAFSPSDLFDKRKEAVLIKGVSGDKEHKHQVLEIFARAFDNLDSHAQGQYRALAREALEEGNKSIEEASNDMNNTYSKAFISDLTTGYEKKDIDRLLEINKAELKRVKESKAKNNIAQITALNEERQKLLTRKIELDMSGTESVSHSTVSVKGFGDIHLSDNSAGSSAADNIFKLLVKGIPVYIAGYGIPKHIDDIGNAIKLAGEKRANMYKEQNDLLKMHEEEQEKMNRLRTMNASLAYKAKYRSATASLGEGIYEFLNIIAPDSKFTQDYNVRHNRKQTGGLKPIEADDGLKNQTYAALNRIKEAYELYANGKIDEETRALLIRSNMDELRDGNVHLKLKAAPNNLAGTGIPIDPEYGFTGDFDENAMEAAIQNGTFDDIVKNLLFIQHDKFYDQNITVDKKDRNFANKVVSGVSNFVDDLSSGNGLNAKHNNNGISDGMERSMTNVGKDESDAAKAEYDADIAAAKKTRASAKKSVSDSEKKINEYTRQLRTLRSNIMRDPNDLTSIREYDRIFEEREAEQAALNNYNAELNNAEAILNILKSNKAIQAEYRRKGPIGKALHNLIYGNADQLAAAKSIKNLVNILGLSPNLYTTTFGTDNRSTRRRNKAEARSLAHHSEALANADVNNIEGLEKQYNEMLNAKRNELTKKYSEKNYIDAAKGGKALTKEQIDKVVSSRLSKIENDKNSDLAQMYERIKTAKIHKDILEQGYAVDEAELFGEVGRFNSEGIERDHATAFDYGVSAKSGGKGKRKDGKNRGEVKTFLKVVNPLMPGSWYLIRQFKDDLYNTNPLLGEMHNVSNYLRYMIDKSEYNLKNNKHKIASILKSKVHSESTGLTDTLLMETANAVEASGDDSAVNRYGNWLSGLIQKGGEKLGKLKADVSARFGGSSDNPPLSNSDVASATDAESNELINIADSSYKSTVLNEFYKNGQKNPYFEILGQLAMINSNVAKITLKHGFVNGHHLVIDGKMMDFRSYGRTLMDSAKNGATAAKGALSDAIDNAKSAVGDSGIAAKASGLATKTRLALNFGSKYYRMGMTDEELKTVSNQIMNDNSLTPAERKQAVTKLYAAANKYKEALGEADFLAGLKPGSHIDIKDGPSKLANGEYIFRTTDGKLHHSKLNPALFDLKLKNLKDAVVKEGTVIKEKITNSEDFQNIKSDIGAVKDKAKEAAAEFAKGYDDARLRLISVLSEKKYNKELEKLLNKFDKAKTDEERKAIETTFDKLEGYRNEYLEKTGGLKNTIESSIDNARKRMDDWVNGDGKDIKAKAEKAIKDSGLRKAISDFKDNLRGSGKKDKKDSEGGIVDAIKGIFGKGGNTMYDEYDEEDFKSQRAALEKKYAKDQKKLRKELDKLKKLEYNKKNTKYWIKAEVDKYNLKPLSKEDATREAKWDGASHRTLNQVIPYYLSRLVKFAQNGFGGGKKGLLSRLFGGAVGLAKGVGKGAWGIAKGLGSAAGELLGLAPSLLRGLFGIGGALGKGALSAAGALGRGALDLGSSLALGLMDIMPGLWKGTKDLASGLWHGGKDVVKGLWHGTTDIARGLWHGTKDIAGGLWRGGKAIITAPFKGIARGVGWAANKLGITKTIDQKILEIQEKLQDPNLDAITRAKLERKLAELQHKRETIIQKENDKKANVGKKKGIVETVKGKLGQAKKLAEEKKQNKTAQRISAILKDNWVNQIVMNQFDPSDADEYRKRALFQYGLTNNLLATLIAGLGITDNGVIKRDTRNTLAGNLQKESDETQRELMVLTTTNAAGAGMSPTAIANAVMDTKKITKGANLLKFASKLGGKGFWASAAAGAAIVGGVAYTAKRRGERLKQEGVGSAVAYSTGIAREADTDFNADGTKKNFVQKALDRADWGKFASAKGALVAADGKAGFAVKQVASFGKVVAKTITVLSHKFLNSKIVKRVLGKNAVKIERAIIKLINRLEKWIVAKGGKMMGSNLGKTFAKSLPLIGAGIGIFDAIRAFISGAYNAPRYFKIKASDCTAGMRIAASLSAGLKSILVTVLNQLAAVTGGITAWIGMGIDVIFSDKFLATTFYGLLAGEEKRGELEAKQNALAAEANSMGVDVDRYNEATNKSFGGAILDKFSSQKQRDARQAKVLGMDVNSGEYQNFKASQAKSSVNADETNGPDKLRMAYGNMLTGDMDTAERELTAAGRSKQRFGMSAIPQIFRDKFNIEKLSDNKFTKSFMKTMMFTNPVIGVLATLGSTVQLLSKIAAVSGVTNDAVAVAAPTAKKGLFARIAESFTGEDGIISRIGNGVKGLFGGNKDKGTGSHGGSGGTRGAYKSKVYAKIKGLPSESDIDRAIAEEDIKSLKDWAEKFRTASSGDYVTSDMNALTSAAKTAAEGFFGEKVIQDLGISKPTMTKRTPGMQYAIYLNRLPVEYNSDYDAITKRVTKGKMIGSEYYGANRGQAFTWTMDSPHLDGNAFDSDDIARAVRADPSLRDKIHDAAEKHGLEWGGDWGGDQEDLPHFQLAKINADTPFHDDVVRFMKNTYNSMQTLNNKMKNYGKNATQEDLRYALNNRADYGATTNGDIDRAVKLKENPLLTDTKIFNKTMAEALELQKAIYEEQKRHNKTSEDSTTQIIQLLTAAVKILSSNGRAPATEKIPPMNEGFLRSLAMTASGR